MAAPPPMIPPSSPSLRKCRKKRLAMKRSPAPTKCRTSTIGRFAAIAPRVANDTEMMVAMIISARMPIPASTVAPVIERIRSIQARWSATLAVGATCVTLARSAARSSVVPGWTRATMTRGTGKSSSDNPLPSHGSSSFADSSLVKGVVSGMPGCVRIASVTAAASRSRSRPAAGRTWMVISLATSDCHSAADALPSGPGPVVIEARNVMMATTATSARPAIEARGTIGDRLRARAGTCGRSCPRSTSGLCSLPFLLIDMQPSLMQHQPARIKLIHQRDVVGRDHNRGARLVQFDEQPQQSPPQGRIDVAGRLVRQQELRPRNHRARDRRALLLAAGQDRRQRVHARAETDPFQEIDDLLAIAGFRAAHHPERQRHVFVSGHVIEQAKVLQHDADPLAQARDLVLAEQRDVVAEQIDQPAGRPQRQEQQPQQRGLAGAGGPGEKLEGVGGDQETKVAQNLRTQSVTQSNVFEPNQAQLRSMWGGAGGHPPARNSSGSRRARTGQIGCASVMVSDSLTVAL